MSRACRSLRTPCCACSTAAIVRFSRPPRSRARSTQVAAERAHSARCFASSRATDASSACAVAGASRAAAVSSKRSASSAATVPSSPSTNPATPTRSTVRFRSPASASSIEPIADATQRRAEVVRAIGGARREWIGILGRDGRDGVVTPYRDDVPWELRVPRGAWSDARFGDVVVAFASFDRQQPRRRPGRGPRGRRGGSAARARRRSARSAGHARGRFPRDRLAPPPAARVSEERDPRSRRVAGSARSRRTRAAPRSARRFPSSRSTRDGARSRRRGVRRTDRRRRLPALGRDRGRLAFRRRGRRRSISRRAAAATASTSPTAPFRCCPSGSRANSVRCGRSVDRLALAVELALDGRGVGAIRALSRGRDPQPRPARLRRRRAR